MEWIAIIFVLIIGIIFGCMCVYTSPTLKIDVNITNKRNVDENKLFLLLKDQYTFEELEQRYKEYASKHEETPVICVRGIRYRSDGRFCEIKVQIGMADLINLYSVKNNSQHERNKMTLKLREYIKERDNYTCQCCGRYMPDGCGLHIDHIIPISKGGKTEPDNLQVLCSICNLKKSDKI